MAKNDVVLVDSIISTRLAERLPSDDVGEVFEYFALTELLKDRDLSPDELESGWVDGGQDGGIDGFYIFVNGRLVDEVADATWPKSGVSIEVCLFTCKHHATFEESTVNSLLSTSQELFDFAVPDDQLSGLYSEEIKDKRALLRTCYEQLIIKAK